jgi:hypothetical protein
VLTEKWEWHQGRRGEYLAEGVLCAFGWGMMDYGGTTRNVPPKLKLRDYTITSPDAIGFRRGQVAFQHKCKSKHMHWNGGSAADDPKYPARDEEGIDRRCWEEHLRWQEATGIPVVLTVITIDPPELIAATLDQLGTPRFSPCRGQDLVNWDVRQFRRICRFDPAWLRVYFFTPEGFRRAAPIDAPSLEQMAWWLKKLQPTQGAFPDFIADFIDRVEQGWLRRAS